MDFVLAIDCPHACPPTGMRHTIIWTMRKLALAIAMSALPGMIEERMRFGIAKEETLLRLGSFHARSRRQAKFRGRPRSRGSHLAARRTVHGPSVGLDRSSWLGLSHWNQNVVLLESSPCGRLVALTSFWGFRNSALASFRGLWLQLRQR